MADTSRARPLPAIQRAFPRVFYGWIVVAGSAALAFVCVGIGFYGQSVLLDGQIRLRGWERSSVSAASTLYFLSAGIAGSMVGRAIDRFGARACIVSGATLMGGALIAIGRADSPARLFMLYPLMAVGFAMCSAVPNNAIITRWFVSRRTRALSVSQTGVSAGGIVIVPLASWLIQTQGLPSATVWLALLLFCVAIPVTIFVLRWDPNDHGLEPDGSLEIARRDPRVSLEAQARVWSTRQALAAPSFWLLAASFSLILVSQVGFLVHELSYLRPLLGARLAPLAVSTTAAGSIVGRLAVGFFAEHFDKRRVAALLFCTQASAIVLFSLSADPLAVLAAAFAIGFTVGNIFMFQSLLTSEIFGIPSFGSVFGLLQLITQVTSSLGPLALGLLSERIGYPSAYRVLAGVALLGAACVSLLRAPASVSRDQGRIE